MRLTHVRLLTDDMEPMLRFYRDVLGLEVTLDANVYFELRAGEAVLGLFRRDLMGQMIGAELAAPARSDAFVLTFEVADVDEAARAVCDRGGELVSEPRDYEAAFLRVAHFRDPDGNLVELNAPLGRNDPARDVEGA